MKAYSLRLKPESSWATPWHADTLFGAIAWTWLYVHGRENLEEVLDLIRNKMPPFVLSDVFPADLLPFPAGATAVDAGEKRKALWITRKTFLQFASGNANPLEIALEGRNPAQQETRLQNSLSRLTDSTSGGELFEVDMEVLDRRLRLEYLTWYLRCDDAWLDRLLQVLAVFATHGFGRRASSGLGAFSIPGNLEPCLWLEPPADSNGFVALSHFLPSVNDPVEGSWRLNTTHPKFHSNSVREYLKGSFLMLRPGATFRTAGTPSLWYGRHCDLQSRELPKALQYGLAFPAPVKLPPTWVSGHAR